MSVEICLSTIDNPFDPIDDFDRWYSTDLQLALKNHRRDSCSMLALFAYCSDNFSDKHNKEEIERAIDEIIKFDPLNVYIKVKHEKRSKEKVKEETKV